MVLHGLSFPSISGPTDLPGSCEVCYLLYFMTLSFWLLGFMFMVHLPLLGPHLPKSRTLVFSSALEISILGAQSRKPNLASEY